MTMNYKEIINHLNDPDFKESTKFFHANNMPLEESFCWILAQRLNKAKKIILSLDEDESPLIAWRKALIGILTSKIDFYPSYFQVRNFYECDFDVMLTFGRHEFCEKLLDELDFLSEINSEVYKFTGRVFLNHKYYELSLNFLEYSKNLVYDDPETHFMIGSAQLGLKNRKKAKKAFETTLEVAKNYYPAILQLEKLNQLMV